MRFFLSDSKPKARNDLDIDSIDVPVRTLSPISHNAMNALPTSNTPPRDPNQFHISKSTNGTIRSVPQDPVHLDTSPDDGGRRTQARSDSAMPHSTKSLPQIPYPQSVPIRQQNSNLGVGNGVVRKISSEFGPTRSFANSNSLHVPEDSSTSTGSNGLSTSPSSAGTPQWSSAVGRANLGKSGRVIERLMGENDMLKRDLNLERLRQEESKQAVKMAEGKMEALAAEYDSKLHDAAINKTLLKRRERQVAEMKSQIEMEKVRAEKAEERERGWREQMEMLREECGRKVEDAQTYASLMEGRNKAMTSHWKEQGAEVNRTVNKLGKEIETLVLERRQDDKRMNMLQGLCDQQATQLANLQKEKEGIQKAFEMYKRTQEESLQGIKVRARAQEEKNEEALKETQKVLGELKWALNIKTNVKTAS
jgi:hypothetical protein